ncbi:MAG: hypothetical protein QXY50_02880 [Candidatus Caldarchaeum sp.]
MKRSVAVVREVGWVGWDRMRELVESMGRRDLSALVAFLFLGGLRVSEALAVTADMVHVIGFEGQEYVEVRNIRLLKRFEKLGVVYDEYGNRRFETKPRVVTASRVFPVYEPLVPYFTDHVWAVRKNHGLRERLWSFGRVYAYKVIRERTGLFPHWFRAMRAVQLAVEYGFSALMLKEFFKWEDLDTVFTYAALSTSEVARAFPKKL